MLTHQALQLYFKRKKKSAPGFSMRSLAKRLDVSPSFLSRIMSGKKPAPVNLLEKLAKALDIEPEFIAKQPRSIKKTTRVANLQVEDYELPPKEADRILRNWYYVAIL